MQLEEKLRRLAGWIGLGVAALAAVTLLGWALGRDLLVSLRPSAQPMKVNSALCFTLAGASLWLQHRGRFPRAGQLCALGSLVIAGGTLGQFFSGRDLHLDELFLPDAFGRLRHLPHPGRMSVQTASGLALVSLALLCIAQRRGRNRWPISAWLANLVVAGAVAGMMVMGFVGLPGLTRSFALGPHIGGSLLLLGVGVLLAHPADRHVRALFNPNATGLFARRLFFGMGLVPLAFAGILAVLFARHLIEVADGAVLLTIATVLAGFAVALFSIEAVAGIAEGREESEQARLLLTARLQEQAAQLQETVAQRTRELREANASLRAAGESNALLALVAQHAANGVMITDADGRVEWVNAAFTRLSGYELAELKGRKPGHVLQGAGTDPVAVEKLRDAERRGVACQVEILNYTKDGRAFWQRLDVQPVRDRSGRLINFVANQTDITEQRAAQSRLRQLNQRLELATRSAALGVWEWDAVTNLSMWDARSLEIYGVTPAEFKGSREDWARRLHPEDHDRAFAAVKAARNSDRDQFDLEFRIFRANDGALRAVQSRAIIQRDVQGRVVRIIGTERDVTEEREAHQKLEALNERLRLALRSAQFAVWEYDLVTGRRDWDERMLEIAGLRPHEFDGTRDAWAQRVHPEDLPEVDDHIRRFVAGHMGDYERRFRFVRPDGTVRHIESHGYLQRDEHGLPIRLVGLTRDITSDKQLEEKLQLAEQRWQLAIEASNDAVWDWDIPAGRVFHDERWARMLGYEPGELRGTIESWKALVHPDDLTANESEVQEHFAQGTPFYFHEVRMRAKNGEWRWILDRGKVVQRTADGRPIRMVGTHSDVTARKALEDRLRQSEELAQEVGRLAQIGGWEIDLASSRVMWTDGARRIYEVDDQFHPTIEGMWQFFTDDALETFQAALRDATPTHPSFDIELPVLTARGRRIWVRILGHGEFRHSRATSVRGAIQDITARHESEEARRELETQLFQTQKMETLGTLAGGIAHDFNNLLTGIIGYHELAADSVPEDHPARACLNEARHASLRARELVEQILTFGRQSTSTEHGPLDLALVVEEARRFLRATLPANITIEVHCGAHCPPVLGDATQIHQVLLNLGSNAAHAMRHQGGVLRIALEPAEVTPDLALTLGGPPASSYVRLSVSDNGHGMDESTRRRIFDPFFTTKKTREGTGLGLAVVHGIVRSHRGAIDVESSPGSGSAFHIYLPAAGDDQAQAQANFEAAPRGEGEYICVVDDEEVVGSCTKLVLESRGYRTLIFSSAEQCLAEMEKHHNGCAVLLTDQTMPGMQGTELAAAMRKRSPDLPVVIMSGYFSKISPQALDELGQIELLAKPFTTDELALAVHRALHPVEKIG
ncbi:MAG TPA: PAS domain-containing protein [Opitutaceae bacterium]|nr:PAS domain-containing protein [Opitutaceae bacterium]